MVLLSLVASFMEVNTAKLSSIIRLGLTQRD